MRVHEFNYVVEVDKVTLFYRKSKGWNGIQEGGLYKYDQVCGVLQR